MRGVERSVIWQMLDEPGMDHCRLWRHDDGWSLDGTVVLSLEERPSTVRYEVMCDRSWATRSVVVRMVRGSETSTLHLHADARNNWSAGGAELEHLHACHDVDLGITPATNTLPIRRLRLGVGQSRTLTAAWVRFPGLEIQRMQQTYTRISADTYRYTSETGFAGDIEVDDMGLVRHYRGYWGVVAVE